VPQKMGCKSLKKRCKKWLKKPVLRGWKKWGIKFPEKKGPFPGESLWKKFKAPVLKV